MQITINENDVIIDGVRYVKEKITTDLVTVMNRYHGAIEYDAVVQKAITWFYGYMTKVSWCAIFVSWCASQCGLLEKIGGKNDNVNSMRQSCLYASERGMGEYFDKKHLPETIKKNDILFFLWDSGSMTNGSSKHVAVAEYDSQSDTVFALGGNQTASDGLDKVCTKEYPRSSIYAIYRLN